ncbi:MAG: cyclic nucleotide-binding domain-containing protein [Thermodesulfobacteria bacterium]|nr:cyclic nucleotide-binding domain-containing protein [Thermodesulfobacteriota bacterium]
MQKSYIFKNLSCKEIKRVVDYLHKRTYKKDEVIVAYGEPGFALYIIIEGKVGVEIPTKDGFIEVEELTQGEFFGEIAVITDSFRTATVKCKDHTVTYVLTRSGLEHLIEVSPQIAVKILYNIAGVIAERLKKINEQLKYEVQK